MVGLVAGILLTVAYFKFRHGFGWRHAYVWAGGPGWGGVRGRCDDARGGEGGWRWRRQRWMTRALFERLQTSPSQEKVLLEAWEALSDKAEATKDAWRKSRASAARAVRGPSFDAAALTEAAEQQNAAVGELRETFKTQLARVHETLDERQRRDLADLIEYGPRGFRRGWT